MIKNYIKIAFRGFWKHKLFTLINIIGLSIGISAALVIYLIVHFNFTFDKSHRDSDRIYRVVSNFSFQGDPSYNSGVCGPLAGAIKNQGTTGIDLTVPFFTLYQPNVFIPGKGDVPVRFKNQENIVIASPEYFKLLDYKWVAGSSKNALNEPNQVVLTTEQAKKYFPSTPYSQVLGKIITYDSIKTTVTGVVQTLTENSDFTFHDFISYSTVLANKGIADQFQLTEWESTDDNSQLFLKISANTTVTRVERQLNDLLKKNSPQRPGDKNTHAFSLQPLSDVHFNEKYGNFFGQVANKTTQYGLLGIASFLLLLGCINFINLTTAQATQRAKEIGIRKTMGSSRKQLIFQFLSETFLVTLLSVIISVMLAPLF